MGPAVQPVMLDANVSSGLEEEVDVILFFSIREGSNGFY